MVVHHFPMDQVVERLERSVEEIGQKVEAFRDKGDIDFISYTIEFYHERQKLLEKFRPMRSASEKDERKENKAESEIYAELKKPRCSLAVVADELKYSFRKFLRILNKHVGYVQDYPGFQTLYVHIAKRIKLTDAIVLKTQENFYSKYVDPKLTARIAEKVQDLYDSYNAHLYNSLVELDKRFAEFNKQINYLYSKIWELDAMAPFRKVKKPSLLGKLSGKKPEILFDEESKKKAERTARLGKLEISDKDRQSRLPHIRRVAEAINTRTKKDINIFKERIWETMNRINSDETELQNLLKSASISVEKAIEHQRKGLAPKKAAA